MPFTTLSRHRSRRLRILVTAQEPEKQSPSGRNAIAHIRDSIENKRPLSWVFTGERYPVEQGGLSIAEGVGSYLRDRFDRSHETVVDTSIYRTSITLLEENLEARILRHDPNVVVLTIGPGQLRIDQRLGDISSLARILCTLERNHVVPVIVAPPPLVSSRRNPITRRWREDISDLAIVHDAVLVSADTCKSSSAVAADIVSSLALDTILLPSKKSQMAPELDAVPAS